MGEIVELVLEGVLCQLCGSLVDGEVATHPRTCKDCLEFDEEEFMD